MASSGPPGGFRDVFGPMVPGGKSRLEVPMRPRWSVSSDDAFRAWPRSHRGSTSGGSPFSSTGSSLEPLIEGMNVPGFRRGVPDLPPIHRPLSRMRRGFNDIVGPPMKPLPPIPGRKWRQAALSRAKTVGKYVAPYLPAAVVGGVLGGVVSRAVFEQPEAPARNPLDVSDYEINTEPPKKKVRFEEEIDFSKPSEETLDFSKPSEGSSVRTPSRLATRAREPGQYDFSTPSRGATRQRETGHYDFSTPSRFATRRFEPGHYD